MSKSTNRRWAATLAVAVLTAAAPAVAQNYGTLADFDNANGANPLAGFVQALDGNLYGTTENGGLYDRGTVFKITPAGVLTTIYSFCSQPGCTDGAYPSAGLTLAFDGTFYGTTHNGGDNDWGTVFKITPGGTLTTLHSFNNTDGVDPGAGLVLGSDGNFYGTTTGGTALNGGTVFKITPGGTLTTLNSSFLNAAEPWGLVQGADGNFYGTTWSRGANMNPNVCIYETGCGSVFRVTPKGTLTTIYSFCAQANCADGAYPYAGLIAGTDGNLYGTTGYGGLVTRGSRYGLGTVFRITPAGVLTTLYTFTGGTDGGIPLAGLIEATDGSFYGTTFYDGADNLCRGDGCGTVFKLTPPRGFATLHDFNPGTGIGSVASLFQGTDGLLYGTTRLGGTSNLCFQGCGTVFSLNTGLAPFVETLPGAGKQGSTVRILGSNFTGASSVTFNGVPAKFRVTSPTEISTEVPSSATTGIVQVTTPSGTLSSNMLFSVSQ